MIPDSITDLHEAVALSFVLYKIDTKSTNKRFVAVSIQYFTVFLPE